MNRAAADSPRSNRLCVPAVLVLAVALPLAAGADCSVSPTPPAPQSCDPGGDAGDGTFCDFTGFTYGSWVSVGTGGTTAATGEARRTVFETQAASTISGCTVYNPENPSQPLFDAAAHARATNDAFEVGVYVSDIDRGQGDPGTLEAANAWVAAAIDFGTMQSTEDLDAIIHLDGGFGGSGGRAGVQLAVRDLSGRTLAAVFAANESPPTNDIVWRELDCPDPRNGCGSFIDHTGRWPGFLDVPLKIPATTGNGIWIELKTTSPLDADAPGGSVLTTDFGNTAALELIPPPGVTVTLATGQATQSSVGAPFDVRTLIEGSGFDEQAAYGAGDDVRTLVSQTVDATAIARATAGSGRLLVATESQDPIFSSQTSAQTSFSDTITASGAETYRFEVELAGQISMGVPPGNIGLDKGSGDMSQDWFVGASVNGVYSTLIGTYDAKPSEVPCPAGSVEVGNACFSIEPAESSVFPNEVVGSGELGDGPVTLRFDLPIENGVAADIRVVAAIRQLMSSNDRVGPVEMSMDLGTNEGSYARFLGITQAFTGGLPDTSWSVVSENGYDYSQPATLVAPVPEPGSGVAALAALAALLATRRTRSVFPQPARPSHPRRARLRVSYPRLPESRRSQREGA